MKFDFEKDIAKFNKEVKNGTVENQKRAGENIEKRQESELTEIEDSRKEFEMENSWDRKDAFDKRQEKREVKGESIVAERNQRQFNGIEPDTLPYFETGEMREVFYTDENLKWLNTEDLKAILEDVKEDGTSEELAKAEQLLQRQISLDGFEKIARDLFRNMLSQEKGTSARALVYAEWIAARNDVMDFEELSKKEIFGQKTSMKIEGKNNEGENIREYIPGEVA